MKKSIQFISLLALSFSAMSTTIDNPNLSDTVKKQLNEQIELQKSLANYKANKGAGFATVGSAAQCDYHLGATKIQDALDANETEIRLVAETFNENILIDDKSITIKGGYADCAAAQAGTQGSTQSKILGVTSGSPVVKVQGSTQRNTVVLDTIRLESGSGSGFFPGGGISTIGADAQVNLSNVWITNNTSQWGGGIAIVVGNTDFSISDSLIFSNTAELGGGIYCDGADASIFMSGNSGVTLNTAAGGGSSTLDGKGGGLVLTNGCSYLSYSGTAGGFLDLRGIAANKSLNEGGGIYADNGARATLFGHQFCFFGCIGDNTNPANLSGNSSDTGNAGDKNGGGAYITGANSELTIYAGLVQGNTAGTSFSDGGGISLSSGAKLVTKRLSKSCWSQETCNYFDGNQSGTGGYGGAIYNDASTAEVESSVFANNRSDLGTVYYGIGVGSHLQAYSSIFHSNGNNGADGFSDIYVFRAYTDADIDIQHSTIADNNASTAVLGIISASAGTSTLYSSIVHDSSTGPVYDANPGNIATDCLIVHEIASFTNNGFSIVDDPQFVDRANGDFHISNTSPAIDYCGGSNFTYKDIDMEDYGWDDPTVANNFGNVDIGADETYANDIIFKNGFE